MLRPVGSPAAPSWAPPETDTEQRHWPTRQAQPDAQTQGLIQVQVNSNKSVEVDESLERWAREELNNSLRRFGNDITSVEVHLSDQNSDRISPDHKRCLIEARLANRTPVAVNHQAASVDEAFRGAIDKLRRALDTTYGKLRSHDRSSIRRAGEPSEDKPKPPPSEPGPA